MIKASYSRSEHSDLSSCYQDDLVEKGFIGPDDKHHKYEYSKLDHKWHSHISNEEWLEKNDSKQLAACQKCALWSKCRKNEHTILTMDGVSEHIVDELSREINRRIAEDIKLARQ